jgi:hypothetical protein
LAEEVEVAGIVQHAAVALDANEELRANASSTTGTTGGFKVHPLTALCVGSQNLPKPASTSRTASLQLIISRNCVKRAMSDVEKEM